jgi:hypothetical protein
VGIRWISRLCCLDYPLLGWAELVGCMGWAVAVWLLFVDGPFGLLYQTSHPPPARIETNSAVSTLTLTRTAGHRPDHGNHSSGVTITIRQGRCGGSRIFCPAYVRDAAGLPWHAGRRRRHPSTQARGWPESTSTRPVVEA